MWTRHLIIVAAALTVTAGVAGCSTTGGDPAPVPSAAVPADPAAALAAAAGKLGTQPAHFTITLGRGWELPVRVNGEIDSTTGDFEVDDDLYVWRRVGADIYVKLNKPLGAGAFEGDVGKWIHKPVPPGSEHYFMLGADFPWAPARRTAHSTGIVRTGDHTFRGTLPATTPVPSATAGAQDDGGEMDQLVRVLQGTPRPVEPTTDGSAPTNGFLATLDADGRFVRVKLGYGTDDPVLTYSDFGTPVKITVPPSGEVIDDPRFELFLIGLF